MGVPPLGAAYNPAGHLVNICSTATLNLSYKLPNCTKSCGLEVSRFKNTDKLFVNNSLFSSEVTSKVSNVIGLEKAPKEYPLFILGPSNLVVRLKLPNVKIEDPLVSCVPTRLSLKLVPFILTFFAIKLVLILYQNPYQNQ